MSAIKESDVRFNSDEPDPWFVNDSVNALPDQASKWRQIQMRTGTLPLPKSFFSNDGFLLIELEPIFGSV